MQGFLFISFLLMAATVPVNLAVAALDKKGRPDLGDVVDRYCRWLFPLTYFGLIVAIAIRVLA
jgi:cadmium resistance protein CadD (predicted permease)